MSKQIYYEEVEVGAELPPLIKHPTTQQLVKWAGASDDYYQIHYDKDFAMANNLPGVIVHGWLTFSFLGQLVTD
ncbi:MAG: Acyl dehydratase, partial [Dehalococcoidia bacterium]|nr:Acyl dehydratase [Dehalococcoidia bacterium]